MDPTVYAQAIKDIESSGGNYGAVGPATDSGDKAYGAYQVMGNNVPDWTEKHYGQRLTPDQFLANKDAQDAVFHGQFGSYVDKYGTPQDAASAWFTGRPLAKNNNDSDGYTTANQYVDKFNNGVAKYSGSPVAAINAAAGIKSRGLGSPALAFNGEDDAAPDDHTPASGALSSPDGALTSKTVMSGSGEPNKARIIGQGMVRAAAALASMSNPGQAAALNNTAAAMKADQQSKYHVIATKDGRIIRYDPDTGEVTQVGGAAPAAPQMLGDPTKDGDEYIKTLDPATQQIIKGWHEGTGIMPSSYALSKPNSQLALQIAAASKAYPDLDFQHLNERKTFVQDAAKTSPTSIGGQIASSNASLKHMNNLADVYMGLHNGSGGGWTQAAHVQNAFKDQTGGVDRSAQQQALETHGGLASGEITKFITGGPGGVHERAERAAKLGNSHYSPEEAAGVLDAQRQDLKEKHDILVDKARHTMGEGWLAKHPEISADYEAADTALRDKVAQLRVANKAAPSAPSTATVKPGGHYVWTPQGIQEK